MSTTPFGRAGLHPVLAALAAVEPAVDDVFESMDTSAWSMGDSEVADALKRAEEQLRRLQAASVALVREAVAHDTPARAAGSRPATWLRGLLRLHPAEAHRRVWDQRKKLITAVQKARGDLAFEIDRIIGTAGNGPDDADAGNDAAA